MKYYSLFVMLFLASLPTFADDSLKAKSIVFNEMAWKELAAGITITPLWKDEKTRDTGFLMKVIPDFKGVAHGHNNAYQGVTVQGTWVHIITDGTKYTLPKGSFAHQPAKAIHSDNCISDIPCIILIHMDGDYDFFPAKK